MNTFVVSQELAELMGRDRFFLTRHPLIYKHHEMSPLFIVVDQGESRKDVQAMIHRIKPNVVVRWNPKYQAWTVAAKHLRWVSQAVSEWYKECIVIRDHSVRSKCDVRCQEAKGDDCDCACLGENHGGSSYQKTWVLVGDTTLLSTPAQVIRRKHRVVDHVLVELFGPARPRQAVV